MSNFPLWMLVLIFVGAAAVVWVAGIQLSKSTDVLDNRLHLGSALGGLIILAVATNLPEIAITVSAAVSGNLDIAVGNILGGIALQTVVLVILDAFGKRGKRTHPLTYRAASLVLVLEGVSVVAVLSVVLAGSQLSADLMVAHFTPDGLMIAALWITGLMLVRRASKRLPWHEDGRSPGSTPHQSGHRSRPPEAPHKDRPTWKVALVFAASAAATLIAGVALEQSGEAAAGQLGLSGVIFGATVLAFATSLPELSTGLQAIRQGDDNLAISDIFGGNAFLPVLFLVATLISGQAVLPLLGPTDIYLTALAVLLTLVYIVGIIFRSKKRVAGMGVDSLVVLIFYLIGIAGLFAVAT